MRKYYDVEKRKPGATRQDATAKAVARKGRNGDTQIVHMSRSEVRALDKIASAAGTKLTRNPKTGAKEAFKLKKILKVIAPIAASIVGGPMAGAAVSAAMTKADGGSWKEAALSGIGSLAAGAALGGTSGAVQAAAKNGVLQGTAAQAGTQAAADTAVQAGTQAAADAAMQTGTQMAIPTMTQTATEGANQAFNQSLSSTMAGSTGGITSATPSWASLSLGDKFAVAKDQFSPTMALTSKSAFDGANAMADERYGATADAEEERRQRQRGESLLQQGLDPNQYHYADGGIVNAVPPLSPYNTDTSQFVGQAFRPAFDFSQYDPTKAPQVSIPILESKFVATDVTTKNKKTPWYKRSATEWLKGAGSETNRTGKVSFVDTGNKYTGPAMTPYEQAFWAKGVAYPQAHNNAATPEQLNKYFSAGGAVRGPGDGMSDGIAAMIDGHQPAAIASGEYIVPADVVSHFGNGDTNAGTAYLDKQMDAIRRASTGRTKQRNKINPAHYLR